MTVGCKNKGEGGGTTTQQSQSQMLLVLRFFFTYLFPPPPQLLHSPPALSLSLSLAVPAYLFFHCYGNKLSDVRGEGGGGGRIKTQSVCPFHEVEV